jgi:hypothetical protein
MACHEAYLWLLHLYRGRNLQRITQNPINNNFLLSFAFFFRALATCPDTILLQVLSTSQLTSTTWHKHRHPQKLNASCSKATYLRKLAMILNKENNNAFDLNVRTRTVKASHANTSVREKKRRFERAKRACEMGLLLLLGSHSVNRPVEDAELRWDTRGTASEWDRAHAVSLQIISADD